MNIGQGGEFLRPSIRALSCLISALLAGFVLAGCSFMSDVIHEELVGPYELVAVDDAEELSVYYNNSGRIRPVVIDVGWDNRYIVATQRPEGSPGGMLSYYYLDIAKDTATSGFKSVSGPLTKEEFEQAKAELELPDFTLHYPKLR